MKHTLLHRSLSLLLTLSLVLGLAAPAFAIGGADDGLVAYWDFENVADGVVPDVSGNGNNGTTGAAG